MELGKFFELIKPSYIYIKITPHKSTRNYNSTNIAKSIALSYKAINKRIRREQKKLWFETSFKISYLIDIQGKDVSFYFIVPKPFKTMILEKLKEIWGKCTFEETEPIQAITGANTTYQLTYKKEDALSLQVDKKNNDPLNNILSVIEIMEEGDRVTILYNFIPGSQFGWINRYETTIKKLKENKPLDREKKSFSYIAKSLMSFLIESLETISNTLAEITGATTKNTNISLAESLATALDINKKDISHSTRNKKEQMILNTQILVSSSSKDSTREYNNANTVCQSYRAIDEDNELIYKKASSIKSFEEYSYKKVDTNSFSIDECQNFIQIPGRNLLEQLNIKHINVTEKPISEKLLTGNKRLGTATVKGQRFKCYLENEYNIGNLPLVLVGSQGGGKSTYLGNYAYDCNKAKEGIVCIDFIKACELSSEIEKSVNKEDLVIIDLSKESDLQGFGFNEIKIDDNMTAYRKTELANEQAQQVISFIDAIGIGEPLSPKMRKLLNAAATISFVLKYNSIKNVIGCLENEGIRMDLINELPKLLADLLEEEIRELLKLNDYDKNGNLVGTKENKIEGIIDRISLLREKFKLKYMYNLSLENNIDLVECMEKGKVVLIKMRQDDFNDTMVKNVLVTYWISKIWLAIQKRGSMSEKPLRCNIIVDEIFQAPTSMKTLEYIIPQSRKFGCKFVFSTQYAEQLKGIYDTLEACGTSYMFLKGCLEKDFLHFKSKINDFDYEDINDMGKTYKYPSFNLVYTSEGFQTFITNLPKPVNK